MRRVRRQLVMTTNRPPACSKLAKPQITLAVITASMSSYPSYADANARDDIANRKIMHDYARCVVRSHHKSASDMIISDVDNATIQRRYGDLIDDLCMAATGGSIAMSFGGDTYRYALADALVNFDFAAQGPTDFADRLPLAHVAMPDEAELATDLQKVRDRHKRDELQTGYDNAKSIALLSRYGECVVRQNPTDARLWLLTPPDTPEESSRINALRPAFAACLGEGTVSITRLTMRGTVAISYYRLAMATPRSAVGKTN